MLTISYICLKFLIKITHNPSLKVVDISWCLQKTTYLNVEQKYLCRNRAKVRKVQDPIKTVKKDGCIELNLEGRKDSVSHLGPHPHSVPNHQLVNWFVRRERDWGSKHCWNRKVSSRIQLHQHLQWIIILVPRHKINILDFWIWRPLFSQEYLPLHI